MKSNQWIAVAVLALGLVTTAVAQSGHQHKDHSAKARDEKASGMTALPQMSELQFALLMKQHHEAGIELARLGEERGTRPDVKALATTIRESQERELAQLESLYPDDKTTPSASTGEEPEGELGHTKHDVQMREHHQMMKEMSEASREKLAAASGPAADNIFITEMSQHHRMGLEMIQRTQFQNQQLSELAQQMTNDQQQQLQQLQELRGREATR